MAQTGSSFNYAGRNIDFTDVIDVDYQGKTSFPALKAPSIFDLKDFNPKQSSIDDSMKFRIETPEQDRQLRTTLAQEDLATTEKSKLDLADKELKNQSRAQLALAGAQFALDVMNTQNEYWNTTSTARFNIMQARNQAADALFRGREAGFQRQLEGVKAGESALLAMAAQGQSVTGAGVQKIQGSLEAIGIENSMREEINAMREALGFQLEELGYEYEIERAGITRDMSMISSGLRFAAGAYGSGAL